MSGHSEGRQSGGVSIELCDLAVRLSDQNHEPLTLIDQPGVVSIRAGERIGLSGASGSGKTTLLQVLSGILAPARGRVVIGGRDPSAFSASARDQWRARTVGMVFQDFHLVPELSVLQNILLPLTFQAVRTSATSVTRARALITDLGLADPDRRAGRLSRGEQQRVAVARALLQSPPLLLADEPTASLDAAAGRDVARLLVDQAHRTGATAIVASHDERVLGAMDRVIRVVDGRLVPEGHS